MKQKNVVVFFTDQQRWDTLGIHHNPLELTPNLDRAAQNGIDIHRYFTCQPVCVPARAALQTGRYPTAVNCDQNGKMLDRSFKTLADYFNEGGYETGYIGKWHLGKGRGALPESMQGGYQYWLASNILEAYSEPYKTILYDKGGKEHHLPGYRVDAIADAGIHYMAEHKDKPFFLFLSFLEPHFQNQYDNYPAPHGHEQPHIGRWTPPDLQSLVGSAPQHLGGYYGMVKRLDEAYGRVVDAIESMGLLEDTYILFTSDHGCHFKTRTSEYKCSGHESSVRVPAILYGGSRNKGMKLQNLVSLIDIPPTLLELAGLTVPAVMQGKSIVPLMENNQTDWRDEVYIQISQDTIGRALRTPRWKYIVTYEEGDACSHADKFIVNYEGEKKPSFSEVYFEKELYDLQSDPYELCNLIGMTAFAEVTDHLRGRLIERAVEAGEPPIKEIVKYPDRDSQRRAVSIVP